MAGYAMAAGVATIATVYIAKHRDDVRAVGKAAGQLASDFGRKATTVVAGAFAVQTALSIATTPPGPDCREGPQIEEAQPRTADPTLPKPTDVPDTIPKVKQDTMVKSKPDGHKSLDKGKGC